MHPISFKAATAAAAFILAGIANGQVIPPDFNVSSSTQLGVAYGTPPSVTIVNPGDLLAYAVSRPNPPALGLAALPSDTTGPFLVVMTDPDASSPQNRSVSEILHWIQPNVTLMGSGSNQMSPFPYGLFNTSDALVPYAPPQPPAGSPPHRYIFFLYRQPEATFALPEGYTRFNASSRRNFDVYGFAEAAGLGQPLAANYFLTGPQNATASATSSGGAGATASATGSATTSAPAQFTGGAVGLKGMGVTGMGIGVIGAMFAGLL